MPEKSRKSMRLNDYDYSQTGAYFVNICTQNRICVFGEIIKGESKLNDIGQMIQFQWEDLPSRFPSIDMDQFIVMPNHLHGIVFLDASEMAEEQPPLGMSNITCQRGVRPKLGTIIGSFKSITTLEYIDRVNKQLWPPFKQRLWQRDFYDHIIRNREELGAIREYILLNPSRWELDKDNPKSSAKIPGIMRKASE